MFRDTIQTDMQALHWLHHFLHLLWDRGICMLMFSSLILHDWIFFASLAAWLRTSSLSSHKPVLLIPSPWRQLTWAQVHAHSSTHTFMCYKNSMHVPNTQHVNDNRKLCLPSQVGGKCFIIVAWHMFKADTLPFSLHRYHKHGYTPLHSTCMYMIQQSTHAEYLILMISWFLNS